MNEYRDLWAEWLDWVGEAYFAPWETILDYVPGAEEKIRAECDRIQKTIDQPAQTDLEHGEEDEELEENRERFETLREKAMWDKYPHAQIMNHLDHFARDMAEEYAIQSIPETAIIGLAALANSSLFHWNVELNLSPLLKG